jgi:hypothetical protein
MIGEAHLERGERIRIADGDRNLGREEKEDRKKRCVPHKMTFEPLLI